MSDRFGPEDADAVWARALAALRLAMPRETYANCLTGTWPQAWQPRANRWTIATPRPLVLDWLRHRLAGPVCRALAQATPGLPEPEVSFVHAVHDPDPLPPGGAASRAAAGDPGDGDLSGGPAPGTAKPQLGQHPAGAPAPAAEPDRRRKRRALPSGAPADREPAAPTGMHPAAGGRRAPSAPAVAEAAATAESGAPLGPNDFYIKLKIAFRRRALRLLHGPRLAVWLCLGLHMDAQGVSSPGIEAIMAETGCGRSAVCSALAALDSPPLCLIEKLPPRQFQPQAYRMRGYVWFGRTPAPVPFEAPPGDPPDDP